MRDLRSWLKRSPQPSRLTVDGREVAVGSGRGRWRDAEETIRELGGQVVQALDAEGRIIRAATLLDDDAPAETPANEPARPAPPVSDNPQIAIAQLVLEATDRGAARHAEAYERAFNSMTRLVELIADRLTNVEAALQEQLDARAEAAEQSSGGDSLGATVAAMVGQAATKGPRGVP
jgi:hypothetical protein